MTTTDRLELLQSVHKKWLKKKKNEEKMAANKKCAVCGEEKSGLKKAYGKMACSSCRVIMTAVKKRPKLVASCMRAEHGTTFDGPQYGEFARLVADIRTALGGVEEIPDSGLPEIAAEFVAELDRANAANEKLRADLAACLESRKKTETANIGLKKDSADQHDIIRDLSGQIGELRAALNRFKTAAPPPDAVNISRIVTSPDLLVALNTLAGELARQEE